MLNPVAKPQAYTREYQKLCHRWVVIAVICQTSGCERPILFPSLCCAALIEIPGLFSAPACTCGVMP